MKAMFFWDDREIEITHDKIDKRQVVTFKSGEEEVSLWLTPAQIEEIGERMLLLNPNRPTLSILRDDSSN